MSIGRVVGALSALAVVASNIVFWAKRRRPDVRALPLDVGDLTEVASIPPPAPAPRHHPRTPSLIQPDVHAFETTAQPNAVLSGTARSLRRSDS